MNKLGLISLLIVSLLAPACSLAPIACTEQWVAVSVEVTGVELDQTFTIRESSGDTIYRSQVPWTDTFYVVADDGYQAEIEGEEVDVRFVGRKNDSTYVSEIFRISADACHIALVSGPARIDL